MISEAKLAAPSGSAVEIDREMHLFPYCNRRFGFISAPIWQKSRSIADAETSRKRYKIYHRAGKFYESQSVTCNSFFSRGNCNSRNIPIRPTVGNFRVTRHPVVG